MMQRRHGGVAGREAEAGGRRTVDDDVVQDRLRPAAVHDLLDRLGQQPGRGAAGSQGDRQSRPPGGEREAGGHEDRREAAGLHDDPQRRGRRSAAGR